MLNPFKLAAKAQEMQKKMKEIQGDLKQEKVEVSNNAVTIIMNGEQKVLSLKINPNALVAGKTEPLEQALLAVFNEAVGKVQQIAVSRMSELTGGMKIPGLNM